MARKRMAKHKVLILALLAISLSGCSKFGQDTCMVSVMVDMGRFATKSTDPDETRLTDLSLLVFDEYGRAEQCVWIDHNPNNAISINLLSGRKYRFVACANFGYRIHMADSSGLEKIRYHMVYPDEYRNGIPMYADTGDILIRNGQEVSLKLVRLMSKISIRLDRNRLSKDVEMNVTGIRIGNCPKSAMVFKQNKVTSSDECFPLGFNKSAEECNELNRQESTGISFPVSLYMLENMQGTFSVDPISSDSEKVLDSLDPRIYTCSYIEIDFDYISPHMASSDGYLKYRFYLGEGLNDLDVERNCHYRITICPEDDGLKDDGWRVDKSHLTSTGPTSFSSYPEGYIRGDIGERIHIGCIFTPTDAPFDVGEAYMMNDKEAGIYDYEIDEDGHGAILTLTGPGSGLIYMSAGAPVNESALWFIEVNRPGSD